MPTNEYKTLSWDDVSEKFYETGVKKGVLYKQASNGSYPKGVAWNGLTSVSESPSGAEATSLYANDAKYINLISAEQFACTIGCYTYPDEFAECNGEKELSYNDGSTDVVLAGITAGQQSRSKFGFSYVTTEGNDTEGDAYGYKIHIVYNCTAAPSSKDYKTINDSPEAIEFSYEVSTEPVAVPGLPKPTATIVIDSTKVDPDFLAKLEAALYGVTTTTEGTGSEAYLPTPEQIINMYKTA